MKICIITHLPFWRQNRGSLQRVYAQIRNISSFADVNILFLGDFSVFDKRALARLGIEKTTFSIVDFDMHFSEIKRASIPHSLKASVNQDYRNRIKSFLSINQSDIYIVHNIDNDYLFDHDDFSNHYIIMDTHDLRSLRTESFKEHGRLAETEISKDAEYKILKKYKKIIAIHSKDKIELTSWGISPTNILIYGHTVLEGNSPKRGFDKNLVYIGSKNESNIDAINQFIAYVWPYLRKKGFKLHVFGDVCKFVESHDNLVLLHGNVKDLSAAYDIADIMINPVNFGSGLKIKNVEAMAYGKAMVTSPEGARGIEDASNKAFLLATSIEEQILCILALENQSLRKALEENAKEYWFNHFSDEQVSKILEKALNDCIQES